MTSQVSYYGYALFPSREGSTKTPKASKMLGEIYWILDDAIAERNWLQSAKSSAIEIRPVRVIVGAAIKSS